MPLSAQFKQACEHAVRGLKKDPLFTQGQSTKDRVSSLERDLLYFIDFFEYFIDNDQAELQDIDLITKLFEALEDYQVEQRAISPSSYRVNAVLQVFLSHTKSHPYYPFIEENINKLLNDKTPRTFAMEPKGQQFVDKYRITVQSYLNSLLIVEDSAAGWLTKQSSFLLNTEKTVKTANNPKVLAMKNIAFNLDLMRNQGKYILYDNNGNMQIHSLPNNASPETVLTLINQVIEHELAHQKLPPKGTGHFYSTIALMTSDLKSELSSGKTMTSCPDTTYKQITAALTEQLTAESKTVRRFEPAHIFQGSSSSSIANAFTAKEQTFGGEDQVLVVTSVRQNINPTLYDQYEGKKKQFSKENKNQACDKIHSLKVEQESLEPNEVLLLHGTSIGASANIFNTGFRKPESSSYLSYFGSLGSNIYFSDSYIKSGTFSTCTLCGKVQCGCAIYADQKIERCVIISKVALGNTYTTLQKEKIPSGYDSAVGISKADNSASTFNSSEIAITSPEQILPLFEVKYFTYENMMKLNKWPTNIPSLKTLTSLIEEVERSPQNKSLLTPQIKKECERLLSKEPLTSPIKKNVKALLDQINIENTYPSHNNRVNLSKEEAVEMNVSNNNAMKI
jgi:hypothetical protein